MLESSILHDEYWSWGKKPFKVVLSFLISFHPWDRIWLLHPVVWPSTLSLSHIPFFFFFFYHNLKVLFIILLAKRTGQKSFWRLLPPSLIMRGVVGKWCKACLPPRDWALKAPDCLGKKRARRDPKSNPISHSWIHWLLKWLAFIRYIFFN